jgi:hypothetical protein
MAAFNFSGAFVKPTIVSDQAQTAPCGEGYARTFPGAPSPIRLEDGLSKTNSVRELAEGIRQ